MEVVNTEAEQCPVPTQCESSEIEIDAALLLRAQLAYIHKINGLPFYLH